MPDKPWPVRFNFLRFGLPSMVLAVVALPVRAQTDYRNLDDDRPLRTEDAYPAERYAFELLLPYAFENERGPAEFHVIAPELEYGFIRNGELGLKLPIAGVGERGSSDWGLAGLRVFGLYNFNTESPALPAFSARADLLVPVGGLGGEATRLTLKAIGTRSWGRYRVHLNASRTLGSEHDLATVEAGDRWRYSLAADRTLFRQNLLLAVEVEVLRTVRHAPTEVNLGFGTRIQWSPTLVLDLGIRRRLRQQAGPDLAATVGLSHAFALSWLLPGTR